MRPRPDQPRSVLVDSGAWLALADSSDQHHRDAIAIQRGIMRHRPRLIVTTFLVDETYTLIRYRATYAAAIRFLDSIHGSSVTIVRVTPEDEARAEAILRQYSDKRFSYTDATSFVIMSKFRIDAAFTFDENFTQYGVPVLSA